MSANNMDQKLLLQYMARCFQNWGMSYITPDVLRKSKKNEDQAIQPMIRLLFDLVILHLFQYRHAPYQLAINFTENDQMLEVILAYLFEAECPLVIVRQDHGKSVACFDFTSSKYLLLACGWVMAASCFFTHTTEMLFRRKFGQIYKPKALNFAALSQKYTNAVKEANLHLNADKLTRVAYLAKILKSRKYSIECLVSKKGKVLKRLKEQLQSVDGSLNIQDVFSSADPEEIQSLQAELKDMMTFQKENMGFRKYWWIWLDQKIIASEYSQLPNHYQDFQRKEAPPESIKQNISFDLEFVGKYVEMIQGAENKLQSIGRKIEELQIKGDKVYKQIERDILQELRSATEQSKGREDEIPSFIGMQLQKYMNLYQASTYAPKQSKKSLDKAIQKSSRKLQNQIKSFISQIDAIMVI